ncbi:MULTISPECIES: hypothetical protein [Aeromonas]|uniref:hypothetical protein n=1 Tax=Aeromonas TaxID=642 RepID=UPI001F342C34|nr:MULTISPECIES: hypothetical protein [Aeromonas]MCF5901906.1 hypothetical protein [Aeromonas veronii]
MKKNKRYENDIAMANNSFNNSYYLVKNHRTISSLFRILKERTRTYKSKIESIQKRTFLKDKRQYKTNIRDFVACTIASKSNKFYSFGSSHRTLNNYHPELQTLLESQLGKIGTQSNKSASKNIIGKCAEVKSANIILTTDKSCSISDLDFTPAIRPRTLEVINRCPNCVKIFGKEL